jgi:hypothetical protein
VQVGGEEVGAWMGGSSGVGMGNGGGVGGGGMAPPTFVTEGPAPPQLTECFAFHPQPIRPFTSTQLISKPLDLYVLHCMLAS